jgi:hypothetical protein
VVTLHSSTRVTGTSTLWAVGAVARDFVLPNGTVTTTVHPWSLQRFAGRWHVVPMADTTRNPVDWTPVSVMAVRPGDLWSVGRGGAGAAFAEHGNGHGWTLTAPAGHAGGVLVAVSPSDVWAVGTAATPPGELPRPLLERWNGTRWALETQTLPVPFAGVTFTGIATTPGGRGWLFGSSGPRAVMLRGAGL